MDIYIVINKDGEYTPYGAKCVDKDNAIACLAEAQEKDPNGGWQMFKL